MVNSIISQSGNVFQRTKEIPFSEVFKTFHGGEAKRNKTYCPFHKEKTPSFHIYENGFFCYGCGESGDSISFVSKLHNLQPLNAAKAIAEKFDIPYQEGPLSRADKQKIARAKAERAKEKRLREAFENWTRTAGQQVRILAEAIRLQLEGKGWDIEDELLPLVHRLPLFEWWADILTQGSEKEKIELYKDPGFRGWFPWRT